MVERSTDRSTIEKALNDFFVREPVDKKKYQGNYESSLDDGQWSVGGSSLSPFFRGSSRNMVTCMACDSVIHLKDAGYIGMMSFGTRCMFALCTTCDQPGGLR